MTSNVAENHSYIILAFSKNRYFTRFSIYVFIRGVFLINLFLTFLAAYSCFVIFGSAVLQCSPIILDVISPLDQPRRRNLLLTVGYSQNNYFYIRLLHEFVFVTLCITMMFATSAQMLIFGYHILSLFKIARWIDNRRKSAKHHRKFKVWNYLQISNKIQSSG